ncbi:VIT and vWA domain-containing protein [Pseudacidovorax intermedius]|uniref:Vault protein inter-alpha-trypsin domain-containing protein n=1 Tax=Pseudacidovorax intermedius TaxID=433924 RepID=A0A147GR69_9BURK|nr:VIT and VWA domain-containing protein [Pseudacidovorax intermedius]KTT18752.1 Vault protein inter-alpha-trypsin domain-containing protein [Pseudacidovorax intermedius]
MSITCPARPARGRLLWLLTVAVALASFALLACRPLHAQEREADAATQSPYFVVQSDTPGTDRLPLKRTEVDVRIAGVIADVRVTQTYRNEGERTLEARYVFPGSTRAAVGGMNVRIADRLITAQIREKQQARLEYQEAKQAGQTAALLEAERPNVFQMNVANIRPGDEVRVELRYSELLVPQSGRYQFVYPTVVGPRYVGAGGGGGAWSAQPTLPAGTASGTVFSLQVQLDAPLPLADIRSPSHALAIRAGRDARQAMLTLRDDGRPPANRDFVLDYGLAGERIQSGLMLYPGSGPDAENFFLAMVEPPRAVAAERIVPRDYLFVVDISGSMHGFPLDTACDMLTRLIRDLRPSDTFNVMLFAGSNRMLSPQSVPATRPNIERALKTLNNLEGGGSTELIPALRRAYAQPKPEGVSRSIVVVTDGYVTVEREAFALVREHLDQANLFAFGIGSSVNRHLIEGLARAGRGEPFVITDAVQAPEQAARFRRMVESPVLTGLKARFEGLEVYDVQPARLPDVLGERPVVLFGKWRGAPQGRLVMEGRSAEGPWRQVLPVTPDSLAPQAGALRALWARDRIAALDDQEGLEGGGDQREAITALGLKYSLLTTYTSFIAVDKLVRAAADAGTTVDHPQPLPEGVSELALGVPVPATPEPETLGAVAVALGMLAMLRRRLRRHDPRRLTA